MINVTVENFDAEVVAASSQVPVLVDFWAPWCGPCKVIGPILEKLETEYAGRFKLVKIDSDEQQELGQAFGIRSIPTCVLMVNGKPVDGFMGAQSEGQIKVFLDKHLPSPAVLEAQSDAEDAQALLAAGDPKAALHKLHEATRFSTSCARRTSRPSNGPSSRTSTPSTLPLRVFASTLGSTPTRRTSSG